MTGKVYCFNLYNEPLRLTVNGFSAGSIPPWGGAGPYTPAAVPVPRARHGDGTRAAAFPDDQPSSLRLDWESFSAWPTVNLVKFPNISLNDDLILYIALNQITVITGRGFVLLTMPIVPGVG